MSTTGVYLIIQKCHGSPGDMPIDKKTSRQVFCSLIQAGCEPYESARITMALFAGMSMVAVMATTGRTGMSPVGPHLQLHTTLHQDVLHARNWLTQPKDPGVIVPCSVIFLQRHTTSMFFFRVKLPSSPGTSCMVW